MPTANEHIRDEIIEHQVDLLGFSRSVSRRLIALINRSEPELRAKIRARLERATRLGFDPGPDTTRRLQLIERQIRDLMDPTWRGVREFMQLEMVELAVTEAEFMRGLVVNSLPVIVDPVVANRARLRQLVTHTPIDGAPLSRLLTNWRAADQRRIMDEVRTGMLFNETPVQISRRIFGTRSQRGTDGLRQVTRRGAQTIANTAVAAISSAADRQFALDNSDIIRTELYVATLDRRVTKICANLDGNRYRVGVGPMPPIHPNCRSRRVIVVDGRRLGRRPANEVIEGDLDGLGRRERRARIRELVGPIPGEVAFPEWFRGRSVRFQDRYLGRTKARLYRRGGLDIGDFVAPSGREYNLDQLRERHPAAWSAAGL